MTLKEQLMKEMSNPINDELDKIKHPSLMSAFANSDESGKESDPGEAASEVEENVERYMEYNTQWQHESDALEQIKAAHDLKLKQANADVEVDEEAYAIIHNESINMKQRLKNLVDHYQVMEPFKTRLKIMILAEGGISTHRLLKILEKHKKGGVRQTKQELMETQTQKLVSLNSKS